LIGNGRAQLYHGAPIVYARGMGTIDHRILFVGGGNMAHAITRGAHDAGAIASSKVAALDPDPERRGLFPTAFDDARDAVAWLERSQHRAVVLAVKPQMLDDAGGPVRDAVSGLDEPPLCVSILAGTRTERIRDTMGGAVRVVRVMPNTPVQVGKGMSAIAAGEGASEEDLAMVRTLFGSVGDAITIDEPMMDAFTAIAGSGPAYLFYLAEALTHGARSLGFDPDTARRIVEQTVVGSAALLDASEDDAAALRARVTSKGGTTRAATMALDERSVMDAISAAAHAARDRGLELGNG